ncbi:hypothetical protein OG361_38865 [Streptomyces sp. NBC_00090]|uniref:hypothetical protein n=1 Tax=Streptomyces sp. NBC_00090 TaxID=2903619 RepID=UPI0032551AB4
MSGASHRCIRAGLFSLVGTGLAITGHHLVSGHPVSWQAAVLGAALLFVLAVPFARTPRSLTVVVVGTTAAQAALHYWFQLAGVHGAHPPHVTHGSDAAWHTGHHGTSMLVAHVVSALVVAWLLHGADLALHRATSSTGRRLGALVTDLLVRLTPFGHVPAPLGVVRYVPTRAQPPPGRFLVLAHVVVRRGPPVGRFLAV